MRFFDDKGLKIMNTKKALIKTYNNFKQTLPVLLGVLILISISQTFIPKEFYEKIFAGNNFIDTLLGAIFGSIAAGNPITSYIIGGELMKMGIGIIAITAFITAWVTVGVIQLPAEIIMLGRKFALARNIISFVSAILIAFLVGITMSFIE